MLHYSNFVLVITIAQPRAADQVTMQLLETAAVTIL